MSPSLRAPGLAIGLVLGLAGSPSHARSQDSAERAASEIRLVRPAVLSPATRELAGRWELRLKTPDRQLRTELLLDQENREPCPTAMLIRPSTDSGCLQGDLPQEWIYLLGYAAGQRLHIVRVKDSVWATVPGDGIISGISRTGDLTLTGLVRGTSINGVWSQTFAPDSLHGTFTLRRKKERP